MIVFDAVFIIIIVILAVLVFIEDFDHVIKIVNRVFRIKRQ